MVEGAMPQLGAGCFRAFRMASLLVRCGHVTLMLSIIFLNA